MPTTNLGYSPFLHPDFVRHGLKLSGQGLLNQLRTGEVELVYEDLRPVYLLGGQMVRVWAHEYAPLGGLLACAAKGLDVRNYYDEFCTLLNQLADQSNASLLVWPFFPDNAPFTDWIEQWLNERGLNAFERLRVHERAICIIERASDGTAIDGNGGAQGLVLRSKKKKEYGRQLRRLNDLGSIQFCHAGTGDDFAHALEIFLKLEALGWKGERGSALICDPQTADFARACLPAMAKDGKARIDWLSVDGKAVAGLISLRAGSGLFSWKIASDPAFAKSSVGVQIMLHVSRQAIEDPSIDYIDSLATANHPMIDHLWAGRRTISNLLIPLKASGLRSVKLAKLYYEGHDQLKARAKTLLKR
ncbi:GNAT family N-acetyltransferase [Cohaesibacter gelatinilyticus]|uniref:Acetyltransferase (GNAT) domain-containing protein n=1 Tax=Cohaesibacter gelatinilyticus TaxID=372072 RepID=A0A285PIF1_9HYPH|nr:GNAT family N-acetyltransferase [Cohaesibacter gelatinilyticus]SNZ21510.1 Acetyltransferase (GNAT) domain-containing protein [Cohaesibacter gelatinilyticus]